MAEQSGPDEKIIRELVKKETGKLPGLVTPKGFISLGAMEERRAEELKLEKDLEAKEKKFEKDLEAFAKYMQAGGTKSFWIWLDEEGSQIQIKK
jgi:hypothetical protein